MQTAEAKKINNNLLPILIVDDEEDIRRSLSGVLTDEGFTVVSAADGEGALELIKNREFGLVLLDIWMPGMDGIETLKRIKEFKPELPVIMISGHATIATAMSATKLGAADFIEKPLDLNSTIHAIKAALEPKINKDGVNASAVINSDQESDFDFDQSGFTPIIRPIVFESQTHRGERCPQRTLASGALLYGQGLHSGKKSGLKLEPLPANSGIHFISVSESEAVPAHVDFVESTGFATTLRLGRTQAGTIEHIMSALHVYGISNLLIKCNGEVPVMDGSAREFCALFDEVGVVEQPGDWYSIKLDRPVRVERGNEFIEYQPGDGFTVDYTLRYPAPVGEQRFTFSLDDVESYKKEIAPARTFGFVKDIGYLQKQGLALGGRFDNFLLIGENGGINDAQRFPNEPVRHKILDCIGDLYLLGRRISGSINASMTGHSDNIELLKKFRQIMSSQG
jgi:UDP-3-O-[3-hydroxymyristoyl] N-acetylglucosamine deacetylase